MHNTRFFSFLLVAVFPMFFFSSASAAGNIAEDIDKTARLFENVYKLNPDLTPPATVVVLPFSCEKKLSDRGAGVAVAALFSHRITQKGSFKVVEREALARILQEQALSLSGAIDETTAVNVGRLSGAQLMITGSIAALGSRYQIAARIVSIESGEILLSSVIDADKKNFEDEAKPYLTLVPEKQAIGLYVAAGYSSGHSTAGIPGASITGFFMNAPYGFDMEIFAARLSEKPSITAGARYFTLPFLMLDASYTFRGFAVDQQPVATINSSQSFSLSMTSSAASLSINGVYGVTPHLRAFAGAGVSTLFLSYSVTPKAVRVINGSTMTGFFDTMNVELRIPGQTASDTSSGPAEYRDIIPAAFGNIGVEFRPQSRFGIGCLALFRPGMPAAKETRVSVSGKRGFDHTPIEFDPEEFTIFKFYTPTWSINTYVALYF